MGEHAPRTTALPHIKNGIDNLTFVNGSFAPHIAIGSNKFSNVKPFIIVEIRRIRFTF